MNLNIIESFLNAFFASIPGLIVGIATALVGVHFSDLATRKREEDRYKKDRNRDFRINVLIPLCNLLYICSEYDKILREIGAKNQDTLYAVYKQYIFYLNELVTKLRSFVLGFGIYVVSLDVEENNSIKKQIAGVEQNISYFLIIERLKNDEDFYLPTKVGFEELTKVADLLIESGITFFD